MRYRLVPVLACGLLASAEALAESPSYPSRPIRVITQVSPGGTADIFIRALGDELSKRWGQPLVVDPRLGGGQIIAGRACAEAPPDGYSLCMLSGEALVYNEFLYKKLPYDPQRDFAPVTNLFFNTQALVVNASLDVRTIDQLATLAKARPKALAYVAPAVPQRIFFERFNRQHGTDLVNVPFRGGGEAISWVLSGTTPVAFFGLANFIPYLRAGTMVGLAVNGAARSPLFPDIPTLDELALGDRLTRQYFGLLVPAATPRPMIDKLRDEIAGIIDEPNFRRKHLLDRALEPAAGTPEEFARFLREDRILSERIVKEAGIEPQ